MTIITAAEARSIVEDALEARAKEVYTHIGVQIHKSANLGLRSCTSYELAYSGVAVATEILKRLQHTDGYTVNPVYRKDSVFQDMDRIGAETPDDIVAWEILW